MTTMKTAILGATGRLGSRVAAILDEDYASRVTICCRPGRDDDLDALAECNTVIDASLPGGTARLVAALESLPGAPNTVICATTGLDAALEQRLVALGGTRRVLKSSNYAAGVAALQRILADAAPMLSALGFAATIRETHHRHKQDVPSGTALTLASAMSPYDPAEVEISSAREGEVIGRHDVEFVAEHERIVVGHEAMNRDVFARGIIDAALWLHERGEKPGFYSMEAYFNARFGRAS